MTHEIFAIDSYRFKSNDELLLDTNIWLFVYGPQRLGNRNVAAYSRALAKILAAKCRIYIDVLIVSEFINTYSRMKWNVMGNPHGTFKNFRNSQDFKPIAQDIAADVGRVLKHCTRIDSGFEASNLEKLIAKYSAGDSDFNDQIITALCKRKGLKLVTDDGDFHGQGIPVVTENRRLLA